MRRATPSISRCDTTATAFRLDIYRLGYYGGTGRAEDCDGSTTTVATSQPDCISDDRHRAHRLRQLERVGDVAGAADRGLGHLHRASSCGSDTGGASHIVFVVRDDTSHSDLLFQTSDTTWQAYNRYGGNSLYVGGPGTNPGRAYKVSYNRPFITRDRRPPEDWLFNAEYPMVRWLEANGYDVSYSTGVDTDRRGAELLEHKVFLSVGHDEYWSGTQRANVEAARAAGVNLAFFSGNESLLEDALGDQHRRQRTRADRTLVCYKETHAEREDRSDVRRWTGTWRDPRFSPPADGGRPENALTGTIFMVNCWHDARSRCRRPSAHCASGATRRSRRCSPARRDAARRHARLRMGLGSRQRRRGPPA